MTTLLTPPAGDPRTPEEYTYDLIKAGQYYAVAAEAAQEITESPTLEIERHKCDEDGVPYGVPWFDFMLGEATISISDKGHGNLCIYGMIADFIDFGPLRDLATLLAHPTMAAALALQTPGEMARETGRVLANLKTWVDERTTDPAASPVTVERHWADDDENPDAPGAGADVWVDYEAGAVVIGIGETDNTIDMHVGGVKLEGDIVTLAALTQIHANIGALLADTRLRAALPVGAELSYKMPPTRMVRVRDFKAACSFPLALNVNIGCAIERQRQRLGLTERQMWDVMLLSAQVIEDMFDLTVGMGILGNDPNKLADVAYEQGFREALDSVESFLELRQKAPEKAKALIAKQHPA